MLDENQILAVAQLIRRAPLQNYDEAAGVAHLLSALQQQLTELEEQDGDDQITPE